MKWHLFTPSCVASVHEHSVLPSQWQVTNQFLVLLVQLDEFYLSGKVAWKIFPFLFIYLKTKHPTTACTLVMGVMKTRLPAGNADCRAGTEASSQAFGI